MRLVLKAALLFVLVLPVTVRAAWLEASSDHFVVYANDSERDIRQFSQQLERFHAAMSALTGVSTRAPSPSNRVTVFVVSGDLEVRKLYGDRRANVGAFYIPRAGGSTAIVPRISTGTTQLDDSMLALLHEYAHHFLMSTSRFAAPRWYAEGAAEFFASANFERDGSVGIGRPAYHRAYELGVSRVDVSELLDPDATRKRRGERPGFYGKSWLLVHYLTFSNERSGQLQRYLESLAQGKGMREAALGAFGDLAQLEKELNAYQKKPSMTYIRLPAADLASGAISVRALRPGEAAMMPVRLQSNRGVTLEQAQALVPEARAIAARFPEDPAVLAALAEAEHDAGNDDEAIAAADAALTRDRSQVNAYVRMGYALFRKAPKEADPAAAFRRTRTVFLLLNQLENGHPLPLLYNYRIFLEQGEPPPADAVEGLQYAADLAPFDLSLRMLLARQLVLQGKLAEARIHLAPIAYDPHGGNVAVGAQRVMNRIDSDAQWDGQDFDTLMMQASPSDDEPQATPR